MTILQQQDRLSRLFGAVAKVAVVTIVLMLIFLWMFGFTWVTLSPLVLYAPILCVFGIFWVRWNNKLMMDTLAEYEKTNQKTQNGTRQGKALQMLRMQKASIA